MQLLYRELKQIPKMLGKTNFGIRPEERKALKFKRRKILSWKELIINGKDIKEQIYYENSNFNFYKFMVKPK